MRSVTSADVARESGVSRTTVSYVLNGTEGAKISEATQERVREAARRLGYSPSAAARTLRRGRNDLVLCVLPDWPAGPVIDTLLDGLATALAGRGLSMLVHHNRGSQHLAELWRQVTPVAVVGLTRFGADDVRAMVRAGIKVVGTALDEDTDPGVFAVPQRQIGRLQAAHLADRGHTRLAYAAPADHRLAEFADRRLDGVRRECADRGLPVPLVAPLPLEVDPAATVLRAWHAGGVTAVAAYNDDVAIAVLAGARARGLEVPADLAVIGVDDAPAARLAAPPLSTVWQAADAQATHLAASVFATLEGTVPPARPHDIFHVVPRAST